MTKYMSDWLAGAPFPSSEFRVCDNGLLDTVLAIAFRYELQWPGGNCVVSCSVCASVEELTSDGYHCR